ncbi:MAG: hypothetical protein C0424_12560 [Sphingobacteriaceae bacterium]|nr:hypothetical protein [Sphingobacteriaceae bacterium]
MNLSQAEKATSETLARWAGISDFYTDKGRMERQNSRFRQIVGWLGISLPVVVYVVLVASGGPARPLESLSHYYHTWAQVPFVLIVGFMGLYLLLYKGEEGLDFMLSSFAGLGAFVLVWAPTSPICYSEPVRWIITQNTDSSFLERLHFGGAGIFLGCLSFILFFFFPRFGQVSIRQKWFYRSCAVVMWAAFLVVLLGEKVVGEDVYLHYRLTFWMECLAIWAFGWSWLMKGWSKPAAS